MQLLLHCNKSNLRLLKTQPPILNLWLSAIVAILRLVTCLYENVALRGVLPQISDAPFFLASFAYYVQCLFKFRIDIFFG